MDLGVSAVGPRGPRVIAAGEACAPAVSAAGDSVEAPLEVVASAAGAKAACRAEEWRPARLLPPIKNPVNDQIADLEECICRT